MSEMNCIISLATIYDIEPIYDNICNMNKLSINMESCFYISLEEMKQFYLENYFILSKLSFENSLEICGFALYFTEYNRNVGWGVYIDDLFVAESYRRKGMCRLQITNIARLCKTKNLKFIKLIYQNLKVHHFEMYEKFGFKNSGMQLMEIFGIDKMEKFKNIFSDSILLHKNSKISFEKSNKVINTGEVWSISICNGNVYCFDIQTSYNCWIGPIMFLNNFNGNSIGVESKYIWVALNYFLKENNDIFGIWADIDDENLEILLMEIGFANITKDEYWTSLVLDENGIENLLL